MHHSGIDAYVISRPRARVHDIVTEKERQYLDSKALMKLK